MPNLAYLGFSTQLHLSFLRATLEWYQQLRVLVVAFTVTDKVSAVGFRACDGGGGSGCLEKEDEAAEVGRERLVVAMYKDSYPDWEREARGGEDVWARAEKFVKRKRGGEIDGGLLYACTEALIVKILFLPL
ncbi:hypothetical protein R3P38DRAFT_1117827 [Favolaschia claudopus]|uniref:Uncharacterized protein n=1 Tax=Favolaschia claudopus TaxID=2862362 RepID=A0AAW0B8A0_9AGAR